MWPPSWRSITSAVPRRTTTTSDSRWSPHRSSTPGGRRRPTRRRTLTRACDEPTASALRLCGSTSPGGRRSAASAHANHVGVAVFVRVADSRCGRRRHHPARRRAGLQRPAGDLQQQPSGRDRLPRGAGVPQGILHPRRRLVEAAGRFQHRRALQRTAPLAGRHHHASRHRLTQGQRLT